MPSEDLFKEFESKHSAAELGYEAYIAAVHAHLPDLDAYFRFCAAQSHPSPEDISPDDFVRQVDAMNFANADDEVALRRVHLNSSVPPIVPLGHDANGVKYRLVPDSWGLDAWTRRPPTNGMMRSLSDAWARACSSCPRLCWASP